MSHNGRLEPHKYPECSHLKKGTFAPHYCCYLLHRKKKKKKIEERSFLWTGNLNVAQAHLSRVSHCCILKLMIYVFHLG